MPSIRQPFCGSPQHAPYLHDGRAATLEEIFTKHNLSGLHGQAADLSPAELADLVEYLRVFSRISSSPRYQP